MTELWFNRLAIFLSGAEILISFAVCLLYCGKKPRFALRLCGAIFCYAGVISMFAFVPIDAAFVRYWAALFTVAATCAAVGVMLVCFDKPLRHVLFCGNIALAARLFALKTSCIVITLLVDNGTLGACSPYILLLRSAIFAVFCTGFCYFLFSRAYRGRTEAYLGTDMAVLCPVFLAVSTVLEALEMLLDGFSTVYLIGFFICEEMYGFIMLLINYAMLSQKQSDFELSVVKQMWNEDRKHYEVQKEMVDIINIKCHDLRHQIRALASNSGANENALREIASTVDIYDSIIKTGSEVLDVILSDFSLRCKNSNVVLTCMADGEKINFMEEMDVYSLFGNLLENAFEYETSDVEEQNRFISLTVKTDKGYLSVHCENYFKGSAEFADGVVSTRKSDKNYHGFGMKSMKTIAEKYGGDFNAKTSDDMFQVDVLIPMPTGG